VTPRSPDRGPAPGTQPKLRALDLFCCAGGASMGLHRAGFDVVGVDIKRQPRYPFAFVQADALNPPFNLGDFDFIWASPPCQAHTSLKKMWNSKPHADLIPQTREMLERSGVPYAIENVPGSPLKATVRLCGTMFGLKTSCGAELRRHRYFETSFGMLAPACSHGRVVLGVYGGHVRDRCRTIAITGNTPQQNVERNRVRKTFTVQDAQSAMGIDWMTMTGLSQAIPPAYGEFIGRAAIQYITKREAA
jgi:DNA (cytosine-5)-methyltransferase 1